MISREEYICSVIEHYLRGEASPADRELIKLWLEGNREFAVWLRDEISAMPCDVDIEVKRRIYENITRMSLIETCDVEAVPAPVQNDGTPSKSVLRRVTRYMMMLAACVAAAVAGNMISDYTVTSHAPVSFVVNTGVGERPHVTLPDGTVAHLNSLTRLSYTQEADGTARSVNLSGEAYFIVKHDPERPFTVHTPNMAVECLGTEFNVKAYATDAAETVVLTDGKVRVNLPEAKEVLSPNTMLSYLKETHAVSKNKVFCDNYTDWIHGYIFFDNQPLSDIANEIYRNYGIRMEYDPELGRNRFYGTIGSNELLSTFRVLADATESEFKFMNDSTIRLYKK